MKTLAVAALLLCRLASAAETFGAEERLERTTEIPAAMLSTLSEELSLQRNGCVQQSLEQALEATRVNVGTTSDATLLIKPRQDAWCLCGAYYCPAWIFQTSTRGAIRLWSTRGMSSISILDTKDRGLRRIRSEGGTAGHGFVEDWSWDGKRYVLSRRQGRVAGQ